MSFILTKGVDSVTLRNPTVGNKYTHDTGLVSRQSRGGTILQYLNMDNQMVTTETLTFTNIKGSIVYGLRTFLNTYKGKRLTINTRLTDIDGFVVDPTIDFVCDRVTGCDSFYTFNMTIMYLLATLDVAYLATEDSKALITELGDMLVPEGA